MGAAVLLVTFTWFAAAQHSGTETHSASAAIHHHRKASTHHAPRKSFSTHSRHQAKTRTTHHGKGVSHRRRPSARTLARVHQLKHAFVASSQLRPMAQQLMTERSPQSYAGVSQYARSHTGEAAAAAYMALGQAYFLDGRFAESSTSFQKANQAGRALDDYADYLGAKALFAQHQNDSAAALLQQFSQRHPDSILVDRAALLMANVRLAQGDPQSALHQLSMLSGKPLAATSEYFFALGKANQLAGNRTEAQRIYTRIYLDYPISAEAGEVRAQFDQMGIAEPYSLEQRIHHANGLYSAGRYATAESEYLSIAADPAASASEANDMLAYAAIARYQKTHHVDLSRAEKLADSNSVAGEIRLYLLTEAARDTKNTEQVKLLVGQLEQRFPQSHWTAEALFSAGNMAMLANDLPTAIQYYGDLAKRFPQSSMAPLCHWHAAWLTYRMGDKSAAARMFDEQIARYSGDAHLSPALYWRGVIAQEVEKNPAAAAAYYQKLVDHYTHYYYADLARERLSALGAVTPQVLPELERLPDPSVPELTDQIPEDDIHVERARLLANAGLNQYIVPEIGASEDSAGWRAYAEAQLYSSDGETWRALHILKQKVHSYFAVPIDAIPRTYWSLLFPQPYWPVLESNARKNNLDPFLVASLIRQESEFNPGAVSYANAWGLMQLLPSVGRELARKERVRPYRTSYLLNPEVNLRLGTVYFRQLMSEFNDQPEYALAAYNAGDDRVKAWIANGPYASMPEFVESIPFTQTREYVEAILRNQKIYRELYAGR